MKECCEACELGLDTGEAGQSCVSELGLGSLIDSTFEVCCKKKLTSTTSTSVSTSAAATRPTTSTSTTTYIPSSSKFTKSLEKYDENNPPPPPCKVNKIIVDLCWNLFVAALEALCDIPDLCAHICIPTADSYRCDCYEGFMLMADGISCKPSKRSTPSSQRYDIK